MQYITAVENYLQHIKLGRGLSASTHTTYQAALRAYAKWLAEQGDDNPTLVAALNTPTIQRYTYSLKARDLAPKTIRGAMIALRQMCLRQVAIGAMDIVATDGIPYPKKDESRRYSATDSDVLALFAVVEKMYDPKRQALFRMALCCMVYAGLRAGEVCGLKVDHCKSDTGELHVINGKGNKSCVLYPPAEFWHAYDQWMAIRAKIAPRHDRLLAQAAHKPLGYEGLRRAVAEIRMMAGLPSGPLLTCHCLRHNFANYMHRNGATINQVQAALRHSQTATTFAYLHLHDGDTQAMARIAGRGAPERHVAAPEQVERKTPAREAKLANEIAIKGAYSRQTAAVFDGAASKNVSQARRSAQVAAPSPPPPTQQPRSTNRANLMRMKRTSTR